MSRDVLKTWRRFIAASVGDLQVRSMSGDKDEAPQYQACTWTHSRTLHCFHDQARGYERKVDRRRSKTFKSITVPEEVLQEAGAHPIVEDDEEDSEEDEVEVDEYGEPGPYITIFFRRFYWDNWDHQSANCIRIAISESTMLLYGTIFSCLCLSAVYVLSSERPSRSGRSRRVDSLVTSMTMICECFYFCFWDVSVNDIEIIT